jgi:hypothetical protein
MRTTLFAAVSVLAMLSTSCQGLDMHGSRENELVFATGFEGETPFAGWQNAGSFATVDKGRNGGQALLTDFSANPKGEGGMVYYPLDIEKVRGCKIVVTCWVKAENVVKQKKRNMAVKVMLHSKSTKGPNWREQYNINGTFDWSRKAVTMDVPDCGTDVWLYFGLQGTTGKAWFDDVEVRVVRPLTLSDYKAPEGLPYKGHNLGRLRGAMSPSNPTVEDVNVLAGQWGANVMRYQMGIGWYKREKGIANDQVVDLAGYDEWLDFELAELDKLLPICRKYGMLVVVDMHSAPGGHGRIFAEKRYQDKFVECWERIARRYKGETSIWGYDFFNEPSDSTWDPAVEGLLDWQGLVQRVATAVRKIDQDVTFIVECADGANSVGFLSFLPIRDPKTVYSVHMYYPHTFTHQGVGDRPVGFVYPGEISGKHWDKAELKHALQPVIDFQKKYNVHIYVGEFSAIRWAPDHSAYRYMRDCIDVFEEQGWDWTYHAFREWNGWSVEYTADRKGGKQAETPTDREKLVRGWFAKNRKALP